MAKANRNGVFAEKQIEFHGHCTNGTSTSEYMTWINLRRRCYDETCSNFDDYGGRGIRVCDRWLLSFEAFYSDMGPRPSRKHSIDRIDNDGDYEPTNCRWSTKIEQRRNQRRNRRLEIAGVTKTVVEWCEFYGIAYVLVMSRLRSGWTPIMALTAPRRARNKSPDDWGIEYNGETLNASEWERRLGFRRGLLNQRIRKYGWPIEKVMTTPSKRQPRS